MIRTLLSGTTLGVLASAVSAQTPPMPGPITGATCVSTGTVVVNATIRVSGATSVFDGGCKTFVPGPWMDLNAQDEATPLQSVLFRVENGATLRNVIINSVQGTASARPMNIYTGANLANINIVRTAGDTAIGIRSAGPVTMSKITSVGSTALDRHINVVGAGTRVNISNCIFKNARKVYRQNGGTVYATFATIDFCDISNMTDEVFRVDPGAISSTAKLTNSRLHNVRTIRTGYAAGKCVTSGNTTY